MLIGIAILIFGIFALLTNRVGDNCVDLGNDVFS